MKGSQRFDRRERVTKRADYLRIYEQGVRASGRFMTLIARPNGTPTARLGIAATKKLGDAVVRNRAKRLARELFRRHKIAPGVDLVVIPRREMTHTEFGGLETEFCALVRRTNRLSHPTGQER